MGQTICPRDLPTVLSAYVNRADMLSSTFGIVIEARGNISGGQSQHQSGDGHWWTTLFNQRPSAYVTPASNNKVFHLHHHNPCSIPTQTINQVRGCH
jgi:hypothetical protein